MSVPRKFSALQYSLDLWMYCREEGPTESMGARQRKSKLPPSTWHTKATQICQSKQLLLGNQQSVLFIWQPLIMEEDMKMEKRKNNSLLLSRKTRLREEMLISVWVLKEYFPATEFSLSFSVLSRGSFFNCFLSLRVNFPLSGQTTPYMPLLPALLSLSSSR